jgi:uncharacterized membrane protein YhfC
MINAVTSWAEVVALLCLALGAAWLIAERHGIGWGLITFGSLILCMSAVVSAVAGRRKGGNT